MNFEELDKYYRDIQRRNLLIKYPDMPRFNRRSQFGDYAKKDIEWPYQPSLFEIIKTKILTQWQTQPNKF